jgi:type VI secretion system protein VasG
VIDEIKASEKPIILFIDEAHTLIGAGGVAGGSDAANLLKPALARGELRTVAATTWSEYKKYFEKDAALARRFQPVKLDEPSEETTILILRGLKTKYEETHGVVVRDDAIEAAAALSSRYISGRQLPDKAVDLLDTSAARVKILLTAKPDVIEDKERSIQALEREKKALERDQLHGFEINLDRHKQIEQDVATLNDELSGLTDRWLKEQELAHHLIDLRKSLYELKSRENLSAEEEKELKKQIAKISGELESLQGDSPLVRVEVDPDVVSKVVSDWTGIPLGNVMRDEALNIIKLEDNLKKRIKGQGEALGIITEVIKSAKAGIKDPNQPLGVFLMVGPSGVGKTETGLTIAELLFGGENFMVTINMSEFQEKHTVSRLIGSPPGYVGYGEGGALTEAVRQRPYSVVLLDEVEKGHLEVMNLFYQVFDKGMLADGEGRIIDFKNTVIFLASNLATDVITELCRAEERPALETVSSAIRPILNDHFKPALLARMTVVPYLILDSNTLKDIVSLKMDKMAKRLAETHKMKLTYSPEVMDQIAARCTEVETGARNIDYIMTGSIMPRMSQEILARMGEGDMPGEVNLGLAEDGRFNIDFG